MTDQQLFSRTVRLAYAHPDLRPELLRILKTARPDYQSYVEKKERAHEKPLPKEKWITKVNGGGAAEPKSEFEDEAKLEEAYKREKEKERAEEKKKHEKKKHEKEEEEEGDAEDEKDGYGRSDEQKEKDEEDDLKIEFEPFYAPVTKVKRFFGGMKKFLGEGMSDAAKALGAAGKGAQMLVMEPKHCKEVMVKAGKQFSDHVKEQVKTQGAVKYLGGILAKGAKSVAHEFVEAGHAIKKVGQGKRLTHKENKALFAVGITVAAVALGAGVGAASKGVGHTLSTTLLGAGEGAATAGGRKLAKGFLQHAAAEAVHGAMGNLYVAYEAGETVLEAPHAVHEMAEWLSEAMHLVKLGADKKDDPMMLAFAAHVIGSVNKTFKKGKLSDESLAAVLKGGEPSYKKAA